MITLKNNAQSVLARAVDASATTLEVAVGEGELFPDIALPGVDWFRAALFTANDEGLEFIKVVGREGDRLLVERAQEGTGARDWPVATHVQVRMTAQTWRELSLTPWVRLVDAAGAVLRPVREGERRLTVAGDWRHVLPVRTALRVPGQEAMFHVRTVDFAEGVTRVEIAGDVLPEILPGLEAGFPATMLPADHVLTDSVSDSASHIGASALAVKTAYDKASAALPAGANAVSATKLATGRTIALSGGATGTATNFNGAGNITIPVTALDVSKATAGTLAAARGGTGRTDGKVGALATARTIGLSGGATGTATAFDGSKNIAISVTALDVSKANAGILPVARGGTGNASGKAPTAGTADNGIRWNGAAKTVSTAAPSGGANGDIWFQYI